MKAPGQFHALAIGFPIPAMEAHATTRAIRRAKLLYLIEVFGSIQALADRLGKSHSQLSQLRNEMVHSTTGKPRTIGDRLAREIETKLNLPEGWMDSGETYVPEVPLGEGRQVVQNQSGAPAATAPTPARMKNVRPVWVVGKTQGGMPERLWDDGGQPVGSTDAYAEVSTTDEHAFACRVVGDSMIPRYMPGEYALVEPSASVEIEDDVLVRLTSGETMLKRLLSRRNGVRLGSYNDAIVMSFSEEEITWIYYVAHPIPARRIRQRIDAPPLYQGPERRHHDQPVAHDWRMPGQITSDTPDFEHESTEQRRERQR